MITEFWMPELLVFSHIKQYYKSKGYDEVEITKTLLDDNDISFNIFLKIDNQVFLKTARCKDLEELLVIISDGKNAFSIISDGNTIGYLCNAKVNAVQR